MGRAFGFFFDFGADAFDVHVEGFGVADVVFAPHVVDELPAGEHSPWVAEQVFQQVIFFEGHGGVHAVDGDSVAFEVHAHAAVAKHTGVGFGFVVGIAATAEDGADAGDEFPG